MPFGADLIFPSESTLSLYSNSVAVPEVLPDVASYEAYGKDNPRIAGYCLAVLQKLERKIMETKPKIKALLFSTMGLLLSVSISESASDQLACGSQRTISEALRQLNPGDTLLVSGACNENMVIPEQVVNVILDGQGTATVNAREPSDPTINV